MPRDPAHAHALAVAEYRRANPRSRAPRAIVYGRNGARTRTLRNVLTDEESPSWDGNWPRTRTVIAWEQAQVERMFGTEGACD
jgi:hypothetical protein